MLLKWISIFVFLFTNDHKLVTYIKFISLCWKGFYLRINWYLRWYFEMLLWISLSFSTTFFCLSKNFILLKFNSFLFWNICWCHSRILGKQIFFIFYLFMCRSFGQNLETSRRVEENFFAILISILGLLIFLYMVGNLQVLGS